MAVRLRAVGADRCGSPQGKLSYISCSTKRPRFDEVFFCLGECPVLAVNRPSVSWCRYASAQQLHAWHLLCVCFSENISRCQHREGEAPLYMKRFRLPASLYRKQGRPMFRLQTIPAESQEANLCSRAYLICRFPPHFRIRQNFLGFHFSDDFSS